MQRKSLKQSEVTTPSTPALKTWKRVLGFSEHVHLKKLEQLQPVSHSPAQIWHRLKRPLNKFDFSTAVFKIASAFLSYLNHVKAVWYLKLKIPKISLLTVQQMFLQMTTQLHTGCYCWVGTISRILQLLISWIHHFWPIFLVDTLRQRYICEFVLDFTLYTQCYSVAATDHSKKRIGCFSLTTWLQTNWGDSGWVYVSIRANCISNLSPNHTLQLTTWTCVKESLQVYLKNMMLIKARDSHRFFSGYYISKIMGCVTLPRWLLTAESWLSRKFSQWLSYTISDR